MSFSIGPIIALLTNKLLSTLTDNFHGGSLDSTTWNSFTGGGATITYDSTGATISYPAASTSSTDGDITSINRFDLTDSSVSLRIITIPAPSTAADAIFSLQAPAGFNESYRFVV